MNLKIGHGIFGQDLDDIYIELFETLKQPFIEKYLYILIRTTSRSVITAKETHCVDVILKHTNDLKKVAIIGSTLPVTYMVRLKKAYPNIKFVIINDSDIMLKAESILKEKFDYTNYNLNPLFNDLTDLIKDCDLAIYPETELLVPFNLLKYKHSMPIFCVNFMYHQNTINTNYMYCLDDLLEACEIKRIIHADSKKVTYTGTTKKYYYALGYDS